MSLDIFHLDYHIQPRSTYKTSLLAHKQATQQHSMSPTEVVKLPVSLAETKQWMMNKYVNECKMNSKYYH